MPQNLELKAVIKSIEGAERVADALPARRAGVLKQTDTYFAVASGRLKLREIEDAHSELIYYRRDESSSSRLSAYDIVHVVDPVGLKQMLTSSIGLRSVVEKTRLLFMYGTTRIHLDHVKSLGEFVEFEVPVETTGEAAERRLLSLKEKFGIKDEECISCSYVDLMEQRCSES